MSSILLVIALTTCIFLVLILVEFFLGFKKIKNLSMQSILPASQLPSVSVILSVLNEENNIENVLTSLVNLDYPNLEVIAVNDRSTDKTPEILESLQKKYSRLRVLHIKELPQGWFGKNHALYFAAQEAKGDWLLFTDADVTMKSDTLYRTMSYALEHKVDHLTVHEQHYREQFWLKILLLGNYVSYSMVMKPWRIRYSWSKKSLGRGAFNLINKESYQKCGGHKTIAMECLDDLKLGELLKKNGCHQDIANGHDFVEFKWYNSLRDMINGLEKNGFAYYNYQVIPTLRDICFALIFFIWPVISAISMSGWVEWLNIINVGLTLVINAYVAKQFRLQKRYAIFYPIAIIILLYTVFNSMLRTYRNNGVIWRGTYYSLEVLKNK